MQMSKKHNKNMVPKVDIIFLNEIRKRYYKADWNGENYIGKYLGRNPSGYFFRYKENVLGKGQVVKYLGIFTIKGRENMGIIFWMVNGVPVESEVIPLGTYIESEEEFEIEDIKVISISEWNP